MASTALNLVRAARAYKSGFGHSQIDLLTAPRLALDASIIDATITGHERYLEGFRQRLRAIAQLCQANRIEPIFMTQPALFDEGVDSETGVDLSTVQVNGRGNGRLEWRLLERYNDVTRGVAADAGVVLIDLARELPKDSRLFYDFLHYTNEGAVRVGEIVAAHVVPRLRARTRPGH